MIRTLLAAVLGFGFAHGAQAQGSFPGNGPSGAVVIGQGSVKPKWKPIVGDCTLAASGTITCSNVSGTVGGNPTFTGTVTFSGTLNDTGIFAIGGTTQTFPTSGQIVGVGDTQVLTNKSIDAAEINSGTLAVARLPVGTNSVKGILSGDNSTLTVTAGAIGCTIMTAAQIGCAKVDNSTITVNGSGVLTAIGAAAATIGVGTTGVTAGTPGDILSVGSGPTLAQVATTGSGSVVLATSPTLSGTVGGALTFSGNLTMSGLATPGVIGGALCASAGGAVFYFSGNNCFGAGVTAINALTGNVVLSPVVSASGTSIVLAPIMPQGRLTLTSGAPVMTASALAQTTIYYDCYNGNTVPVWNGTIDVQMPIPSCEISTALASSGTGVITGGNVLDVWAVNVASSLTLCVATSGGTGGGWALDTAGSNTGRGTGYSQLDMTTRPQITNKNAITNCFNGATNEGTIAVNRATYLGTFYSTANGQTAMVLNPAAAAGGSAPVLGLYNAYNRVPYTSRSISSSSTTYISSTVRALGASTNNRVSWVDGLGRSRASARVDATAFSAGPSAVSSIGIDFNGTTVFGGFVGDINPGTSGPTFLTWTFFGWDFGYFTGFNFAQAVESGLGSNGNTLGAPTVSLDIQM